MKYINRHILLFLFLIFSFSSFAQNYNNGFMDSLRFNIRNNSDSVWFIERYSDVISRYDFYIFSFIGDSILFYNDNYCFESESGFVSPDSKFNGLLLIKKTKSEFKKLLIDYYKSLNPYDFKFFNDKKSFTLLRLGKRFITNIPSKQVDIVFFKELFLLLLKEQYQKDLTTKENCTYILPQQIKRKK